MSAVPSVLVKGKMGDAAGEWIVREMVECIVCLVKWMLVIRGLRRDLSIYCGGWIVTF